MKLRDQLLIRCLAAAAIALGLFGALLIQFSFHLQLARERTALEEKSAMLAQSMEAAAVNYALQSIPLSEDLLSALYAQMEGASGLYDTTGVLLLGDAPSVMPSEGIRLSGRMLYALRPVALSGKSFHLLVASDLSTLYETRRALLTCYALLYLVVMALFAAVMLMAARRITRPLEQLARTSLRLAEGEMGVRAEPDEGAETGALARSFNQMADSLTGQLDRQQRFIADLTHEIKTPLAAIIGHADLIRSGRISGEESMLAAHRIVREGQRLNALTARLIELILLNRDHPAPSPVFARPLVEEAAETLLPLAHERGAELSYLCADAIIEGDGALLRVLLNNLADNALKSSAQHVRIEGGLAGERFTLTVQDDGCGMDETALRHITEPFYRVDKSRSRAQGGAGLGLSLCAEIARLHAADLSFESALGKGTRVTLSMPGKEAAVNDEA